MYLLTQKENKRKTEITELIALSTCDFILWKVGVHFVTVKVSIVSFTVGIMHPQCFLLNQMWQYTSLSNQYNETNFYLKICIYYSLNLNNIKFMINSLAGACSTATHPTLDSQAEL